MKIQSDLIGNYEKVWETDNIDDYVTGDTYARSETTGKDEFFQFILPKAKVLSESNTITLEAEGDSTVFSMSLKVLRPKDGVMMKLVQYNVAEENA